MFKLLYKKVQKNLLEFIKNPRQWFNSSSRKKKYWIFATIGNIITISANFIPNPYGLFFSMGGLIVIVISAVKWLSMHYTTFKFFRKMFNKNRLLAKVKYKDSYKWQEVNSSFTIIDEKNKTLTFNVIEFFDRVDLYNKESALRTSDTLKRYMKSNTSTDSHFMNSTMKDIIEFHIENNTKYKLIIDVHQNIYKIKNRDKLIKELLTE